MIRQHLDKLGRVRTLLLNAGLMLVAVGVAAIAAELLVRLVAPQQLILIRPDLWQPADTVGWLHRPNVHTQINTGERTVTVHTDGEGFRVGAAGPVEASDEVLLLGDSFVEALQVEYEQSAAGILEKALPAALGQPVAVRNAGVGGWDPDQYLLRLRTLLAQRNYDVVILVLYMGNDVIGQRRDYLAPRAPVERYSFRFPRELSSREFVDGFLRPVNDFLEVRSHLFVLTRSNLRTVQMRLGLTPLSFPTQFLVSEETSARWSVTASLCDEMSDLVKSSGSDVLFVFVPAAFQVAQDALERELTGFGLEPDLMDIDLPNRKLAEEFGARGLDAIDLLPQFRAADARGDRLFGRVDHHLSPEGNRLFGELLTPVVADALARRAAASTATGPR